MQNNFVLNDEITEDLEKRINFLLEPNKNDILSELFFSEDIAKCDRRVYYKSTTLSIVKNRRELYDRNFLIKKWSFIIRKLSGIEVLEEFYEVSDHNYNYTSTVDIVAKINDCNVVIMIQEVDNDLFNRKNVLRHHVLQVMSQMWLIEVNDGLILYENKDTKEFTFYHIIPNKSVISAIKAKLKLIFQQKQMGILPERKYTLETSKECQECEFKKICWKGSNESKQ